MVNGSPLTRTVCPMIVAPAFRCCQSRWLMIATRMFAPGRSSSGLNARPSASGTPKTSK